ncbi:phage integrase SAM-like domain-containing protein [Bacteroides fragilis]|nr:phage integrase SAM-like domain-containing protein [Bacteroides fragilis]
MKTYSRRLEIGTFRHHKSCMRKFKEYCEGLQFHELTEDFLRDYLIYMKKLYATQIQRPNVIYQP